MKNIYRLSSVEMVSHDTPLRENKRISRNCSIQSMIEIKTYIDNEACFNAITERETGVILTQKVKSLTELKLDPGFRVIGGYLSQIDPQYRVNLTQLHNLPNICCVFTVFDA